MSTPELTLDAPTLGLGAVCEPILRALPDWFGIEEATAQYIRDIERMPTILARADATPVGFITLHQHFPRTAEVHVMGILPDHHRRGIGRALLDAGEAWLRERGVLYLQVKTVSPSSDCAFYAKTRAFYMGVGFQPLEEFPTLWDERNPCLVLVKGLRAD